MKAILALEDGRYFEGTSFGAAGTTNGEACFNTSMSGYQEVLTDPSYRGQIVTMTYPMIGNYGINLLDDESAEPHVRGFVIEELCDVPSNWRSTESLHDYLTRYNIPGIQGIDTRALTKHLRTRGAMQSVITTELTVEQAIEAAKKSPPMSGSDYVKEVTTKKAYLWDPEDTDSREWDIPSPSQNREGGPTGAFRPLPEARHHIVAYDFGIKKNILRSLRQAGFRVEVVPATTKASDVLAKNPDGVFLSNGPGDPAALGYIHEEVKQLIGKTPIFAICLGHQLLGHAYGGKTFKLKFGHRGGNQPVKDLRSGKVSITAQNHGFAIDPSTLPSNVEVTHINLNDGTIEGMRHREAPVLSVQYHPEAAPGPNDAKYFFSEFSKLIDKAS
ncbi:glutamine-hydrolyzing carbamoyl-phosphate synthase small subunit [Brevifollis gellanilyticus]|uniref:Carbamoyl phosphate synthase small chain n=1 Tax=Brevifollis gellanilyticus TaxID=748831 RepID=A0A512MFR0_9BACT|nr:glutamine-hydrolyzing carbamoyl-phosphate synthase small subunit [Brevifollis gellanilyticus]GEP45569.1 carbamoyl-phosphate synthase small chain [Brevifollis gellanilyticus]